MKVYLRTFGCRANQYDTEAVRALVASAGHEIVGAAAQADVAVFNSCAVTTEAEAELRQVVRRAAREQPRLRSVVMGCAAALDAQRPAPQRLRNLPTVEHIVDGADLGAVASALELPPAARRGPLTRAQASTRALLRIQDGCDEHCTFCATTLARGDNRSRDGDLLVAEAAALAEVHPEIVITGIHIGSYGADIGTSLGLLVARLVRGVPGVRFRLSSIEATEIDASLAELLSAVPERLAPHIHAPLQSGSDRLLRRMGRHWYTSADYAHAIERLVSRIGPLGLGADIIAGFPGETNEDHAATLSLLRSLPFTYLHVFPYSSRPGTAAARLPDHVAPSLIRGRAAELRALGAAKSEDHRRRRAGGTADVVVTRGGRRAEGVTGDFLTLPLDDPVPRGTRFTGRLYHDTDGRLTVRAVDS